MKKIWLMLLMICSVCAFSACSDDDDDKKDDEGKVCPVTEIVVPETAEAGQTVKITGKGFATTAKLALKNEKGEELDIDAKATSTELTFTIPTSFEVGTYKVILIQNGKWEIGNIKISASARAPRVKEMLFDFGWGTHTFSFKYDEKDRISAINFYTDENPEPEVYDIAYESDKIIVSNSQDFTYNLENNQIISTSYDDGDGLVDWPWEYDENNQYLTFGGYEEISYNYSEEGNLNSIGYAARAYFEDAQQKNNFELIDPVICMLHVFSNALEDNMADLIAHWVGICGKSSTYLPTQITTYYEEELPIQYQMDTKYPESIYEAKVTSPEYEYTYLVRFIYE